MLLLSLYASIYKKMLMKPETIIPDSNQCIASSTFHHFVGGFVIDLPCIISINNTLFVQDDYSLIDFTDTNGGFIEHKVKFIDAYLTGYMVTIVVLDIESGELIKRKHRLGNDNLPCNWVLTDLFNPNHKKDDLLDFEF
jgi:hypothetical protein